MLRWSMFDTQSPDIFAVISLLHNRLNSRMHRKLKLAPSPTCPCGQEEQTTKHILQRCPLYKATREDVWPVSTSLMTKLYGCKQELEKKMSFISRAALIVQTANAKKKISLLHTTCKSFAYFMPLWPWMKIKVMQFATNLHSIILTIITPSWKEIRLSPDCAALAVEWFSFFSSPTAGLLGSFITAVCSAWGYGTLPVIHTQAVCHCRPWLPLPPPLTCQLSAVCETWHSTVQHQKHAACTLLHHIVGLVVKASALRVEDPRFESRLRQDFPGVESYQWLQNWHSSGYSARCLALKDQC